MSCSTLSCFQRHAADNEHKQQQLARLIEQKKTKILILGPGNSGKTTILNQIRRINNPYDEQLLDDRRRVSKEIRVAVIEYIQILCQQSVILSEKYHHINDTIVDPKCEYLRQDILALKAPFALTPSVGFNISILWNDKGIRATLRRRQYFDIDDNVEHFLNKIEEISDVGYLADFDDYLRFSQRSVGFSHLECNITSIWNVFDTNLHNFEFIDVKGQRCERKKWTRFLSTENISAVLFVVAISDYDLTLFEDNATNQLVEAVHVFRDIMVRSNGFKDKKLVILFNKFDKFQEKIKKIPITVAFDSFPTHQMDPNNANDVIRFVAAQMYTVFEHENVESTAPLHIIRTNALDPEHMEKVITDITVDLIKKNVNENVINNA